MNREIKKKVAEYKKKIESGEIACKSEKMVKVIKEQLINGRTEKEALTKAGYKNPHITRLQNNNLNYKSVKRPLVELLESVANLASARLEKIMKSSQKVGVRDTAYTIDVAIKNNRLLKGLSTENSGDRINFFIPDFNAVPANAVKMLEARREKAVAGGNSEPTAEQKEREADRYQSSEDYTVK